MADPLLVTTDLTVRFNVGRKILTAVDGVSLAVGKGETVGLVGESGSGKSTFGLAVMRATRPAKGRVVFDGTDITDLSEKELRPYRTRMQMIFQNPFASLDPGLKVGAAIAEPIKVNGLLPRAEVPVRVAELLQAVGLPEAAADRYPRQFSGGQRQRVSIARALAVQPELLIADEPVSALDVSIQAQVMSVLDEVKQEFGLTTVVIAHDLALVYQVTDRVAVMYLGQIIEEGPTPEVVFDPLHPYTASLLSATPIPEPKLERERKRIVLEGDPPSAISPPPACRFHTRCPIARPICSEQAPAMDEVAPGRRVACHFAGEIDPVITVTSRGT